MNINHINPLTETELAEILQIAQNGEIKLKEMSDYATVMAEKWRVKTHIPEKREFDVLCLPKVEPLEPM